MAKTRIHYKEGTWFAVPLRTVGYAVGLVARTNTKGVILGYFFACKNTNIAEWKDSNILHPEDAILIRMFGDLGLSQGEWPILYHASVWDRERWPLPLFGRIAVDQSWATAVQYDEDDVNKIVAEHPTSVAIAQSLPEDGLSGYGAIEIRLTRLLDRSFV